MADLAINLLASIIAGTAVWAFAHLRRRQRTERMRAFFGAGPGTVARVVVARHHASPEELSVHREDAAATVELAAMIMACGGRSDLIGFDRAPAALGSDPEICVGGPTTNLRTASHLRLLVPGLVPGPGEDGHRTFIVGDRPYTRSPHAGDDVIYAALVKVHGAPRRAPVFLVCGMTASANRAAAHHLVGNHLDLARRYGTTGSFALLLSLRGLSSYGTDAIVEVDDITDVAFTAPAGTGP